MISGQVNQLKFRNTARNLSIRARYNALTSNEQVKLRILKKAMVLVAVARQVAQTESCRDHNDRMLRSLLAQYLEIKVDQSPPLPAVSRYDQDVCIDHFDESECYIMFRFRKPELRRLFTLLRFPEVVKFENRGKMSGEEVFLRGLYELAHGETKENIALNVFGRHVSDQSRAFKYFIDHMYQNFRHLVFDNLNWWKESGWIQRSAEAIGIKINKPDNSFAFFIDCNCLETSRPGGGPTEDGANARRWNPNLQRAYYNGWKSIHGLKHQTVDCALGMTVDMIGPTSVRRNDITLLTESRINDRLRELFADLPIDYCIFGDSAYLTLTHIRTYIENATTEAEKEWNEKMKSVRISIEWNYMVTASLFKFLGNHDKLRILESSNVARCYTVATLFRNFHIACYGGQTSNYFDLILPDDFLEHYINQTLPH